MNPALPVNHCSLELEQQGREQEVPGVSDGVMSRVPSSTHRALS